MPVRTHDGTPVLLAVIVLAVSVPWVGAIVWAWRQRPRDGWVPPSMADYARRRLWPR